ncbi:asparagine synthase (glutamine-hydrolyzing) [Marinobacter flavimaris]|uniref:asparagine synthase (glutamine-hydrolyzing) n=1 Tax=Marinobacter flavimaris TaxID=262076 RepID=UPI0018EE1384|nr:asparagine synthase (glutamine-hydrolyzing) [Marinobacter flavimaris]
MPLDIDVLRVISHRGPDSEDLVHVSSEFGVVCFGHVRLAIQDLSPAGHQPMFSSCGRYLIIYNGEIYNHAELRGRLPDLRFKGHSDTETVVNYLARFGIESVKDFNGIFALAVFDLEAAKVHLARDRYGVKPLYYSLSDKALSFASEIRPLNLLNAPIIDKQNLATLLKLRFAPAPLTIFNNVEKLRPGHIFTYDLCTSGTRAQSFVCKPKGPISIAMDQAIDDYGRLFEQAVKRQLLADVEVGVLLSGGIDSALVAFFAQKYSAKPIKTFTVGFLDEDDSDETEDARQTSRILGTEHHEIRISRDEFEDAFGRCVEIVEEPLGTTSIIPMYYLNKRVAELGVSVVLTGQGADEPLGGYNRYRGEMLYGAIPPFVFKFFSPFLSLVKNESLFRAIYALGEKDITERWKKIYTLFNDRSIYDLIGVCDVESGQVVDYWRNLLYNEGRDSVSAMMSNDVRMNLSDDLLLYTDKISMHFSIEARVPMLDNDLVDFVESLPLDFKIRNGAGKYIHKKFAESVLPPDIVHRKKKGFKSPTEKWFMGERGEEYKKMLQKSQGIFSKIFNVEEVSRIFDSHLRGKRNLEKQLFLLVSIFYWMQSIEKSKVQLSSGLSRELYNRNEAKRAED